MTNFEKKLIGTYENYIKHLRRQIETCERIDPKTLKKVIKTITPSDNTFYVVDTISSEITITDEIVYHGKLFKSLEQAKIYQLTKLAGQKFGEVHLYLDELLDELETLTNKYPEYAL